MNMLRSTSVLLAASLVASMALAQAPATKPAKDASGATFNLAGQSDAAGGFHYRDVLEGADTTGAPQAWLVDANRDGHIVVDSAPLPAGAASSALQSATQAAPGASSSAATGVQGVSGGLPLSVTLPTGAATSANQASEISTLGAIQGDLTAGLAVTGPLTSTQLGSAGLATNAHLTETHSAVGTAASTAVTVQGAAGGSALPVSGAAGAIVDLGTGANPAAGTVNANLKAVVSALGSPLQAGGAVNVSSSALPAGAATAAAQAIANTALNSLAGTVNGTTLQVTCSSGCSGSGGAAVPTGAAGSPNASVVTVQGVASMTALKVDGSGVTQPVSAASLPLPAGAATATGQATAHADAQAITTTLGSPMQAGGTIGNSAFGVTGNGNTAYVTAGHGLQVDGSAVTQPVAVTSLPLPAGAATAAGVSSVVTALGSPFQAGGLIGNSSFGLTGNGNAVYVSAAHALQVDASATTQPVSASALPLPAGAATSALQSNVQAAAGTSSTSALGVQGVAGGVAIPVSLASAPTTTVVQSTATALNATVVGAGTAGTAAGGVVSVQGVAGGVAQPISAASLPLPAGASTASGVAAVVTALGSPMQSGGSIGNTAFGLTGNSNTAYVTAGHALQVDASATTQPVSATALPLPVGAATSASQTNVQSALGTAASTAVTIQGGASGVAVPVSLASAPTTTVVQSTAANLKTTAVIQGSATTAVTQTTSGALAPPIAASGKITAGNFSVTTTWSQMLGADANRILLRVQQPATGTPGIIYLDEANAATINGACTASAPGAQTLPATVSAEYLSPIASTTAINVCASAATTVSYANYDQ